MASCSPWGDIYINLGPTLGGAAERSEAGGAIARLSQAPSVTAVGGDTSPKGGGKREAPSNTEETKFRRYEERGRA